MPPPQREKLGTAYSVPRRTQRHENALPFGAAWTERAVPNFSPPRAMCPPRLCVNQEAQ